MVSTESRHIRQTRKGRPEDVVKKGTAVGFMKTDDDDDAVVAALPIRSMVTGRRKPNLDLSVTMINDLQL